MNKRITKKGVILLFVLALISGKTIAQAQYGTWTSVDVEKKIGKWNFAAETELRTIYIVRLIDRWSIGFNANYKIIKPIEIDLGYQLMNTLDKKYLNYQFRNRFTGDISGKYKLGDFSFSLSEGVQLTKKNASKRIDDYGVIDTYKIDPAWIWKNAFQVQYNIPKCKLTPGAEIESYYELNNPDGNRFEKLRYTLFFKYKVSKQHSVKLFGLINNELGTDEADYSGKYILGINYTYTIK